MKVRAISPVVATLILIIVAVVAGVAVYGFITGFIAQTTSQSQSPSSIVIDAASLDSNGDGTVVVRNVGLQSAEVVAVYILNASDQSLIGANTTVSQTINPGNTASISYTTSATGLSGWYIIKVVTKDGAAATIKVKV